MAVLRCRTASGGEPLKYQLKCLKTDDLIEDNWILLNISGGGIERLKSDVKTRPVTPGLGVQKATAVDIILEKLASE